MGLFTDITEQYQKDTGTAAGRQTGTLFGDITDSWYEKRRKERERYENSLVGKSYGIPGSLTDELMGRDMVQEMEPTELIELYNEANMREQDRLKKIDQEAGLNIDYSAGGEIREGERPLGDKIRDFLPEPVAEKVYDPIREGLFGRGEFSGTETKQSDGLVGFLWPNLTKSDSEKIMERYDALRLAGDDNETAMRLAQEHVKLGNFGDLEGTTKEQEKALDGVRRWEQVDLAFAMLDVASLGAAKPATTAARLALKKGDDAAEFILRSLGNAAEPIAKRTTAFNKFRKWVDDSWITAREWIEDDWIRVKKLMQQEGVVVKEGADPYTAEILSAGRASSRIEKGKEAAQSILDDVYDVGQKLGMTDDVVLEGVNKYLIALHAPERIKAIGDKALPFTKAEAEDFLKGLRETELYDDVKRIADNVKKLHDETLDILREGGVITDKLYTQLRNKYAHHVPLQRIFEESEDVAAILARRGTDVRTTGIKAAKGSERAIDDIVGNVIYNREQAVLRAEKNRVANEILQFARNNPQLNMFKIRKPKAIGESFADIAGDRVPIMEKVTDPKTLQLYEDGKKILIEIADERLAVALRGVNRAQQGTLMRAISAFTRFYSGLATRFNPEFALSNKIRDLQEAVIYAAANGQGRGAARAVARDPKSMGTVVDAIRGANANNADVKLYQQMVEDGGTTGGFAMSTRAAIKIDLEKMRKLTRSSPRRAATKLVEYVDNWNKIFEESTRFSVYKESLAQGMTRTQAARMAKESTINFNKMGTGGPIINGLYMFANASIQGNAKMLRALRNPKVAGTVVTAIGTSVFAVNEWNDTVDPEWRDKVSKWDRMNGLTIMLPSDEGTAAWFTIPISWGLKPIKVATDQLYDLSTGYEDSVGEAMGRTLAAMVESYNPVGGTDVGQVMTPTIADVPMDIIRNNAWYGGKIAPDWDKDAPDSTRYFPDLRDTATGRTMVRISRGLSGLGVEVSPENMNYAFEQYIGGAGRTTNKAINTIRAIGTDDSLEVEKVPFLSRFLRIRSEEEIGAGSQKADDIRNILTEQSRERFYLREEAEDKYQLIKNSEDPVAEFNKIAEVDRELAKKILEIKRQDELNLNYTDRLTLDLGVKNGERARYIYQEMLAAENDEQRQAIWNEYVEKKIITKEVAAQVNYLFANQ